MKRAGHTRHCPSDLRDSTVAYPGPGARPTGRRIGTEAIRTIQDYVRINTSNPPGDVLKAADFLTAHPRARRHSGQALRVRARTLDRPRAAEGDRHREAAAPAPSHGRRADRSARWKHDPFGAEIADGQMWGRGTIDMKGLGVVQLMAFLSLKRQNVPLDARRDPDGGARRRGGRRAGRGWMRKNHYAELDPEYVIDEGGFGSRDLFAPGKLVFGISVAEKKILWLKLRAEGVAGHGSQPHDQNPNDRLVRALARLLGEPLPASSFTVLDTMKSRVGTFCREQVQQRDPAFDDLADEPALWRRRSAEGQRHPVGRRGDARLPRAAGHVEGSVAGGDSTAARRSDDQDRDHHTRDTIRS